MKNIITVIILNLLLIMMLQQCLYAQDIYLLKEHFDNNNFSWYNGSNENMETKIENGKFIFEHKRQTGSWMAYKEIPIDESKDFEIEATITQLTGVDNYGIGIMWGLQNVDNNYQFMISSNGYFTLGKYYKGDYIEIKAWTKIDGINPLGSANLLKIYRTGSEIIFFVNGNETYRMPNPPFYGSLIGFVVNNRIKAAYDDIIVKQAGVNVLPADAFGKNEKENVGELVNSSVDDLSPLISPDGRYLYFDRKHHPENSGGASDDDDIWYSVLQTDGSWSKAVNIGTPLNNSGNNFIQSIMPDGNTLLLANVYNYFDGSMSQGVSVSHRERGGWSFPKKQSIKDYENLSDYVSYYLSNDGKALLMAIETKKSVGGRDLFVSFNTGDNEWSKPKNMGAVINTKEDETNPFLAADGVTLYYSTSGLKGYGDNDLYISKRLDDTWLNWSMPVNMGAGINASGYDAAFAIPASGEYAYFISTSNSFGKADIFRIRLAGEAKPDPVVLVQGKVLNKKTNEPVSCQITYNILPEGTEAGVARSEPTNGEYKIVLPFGKLYGFLANAQGFFAINENLDVTNLKEYAEIERNLYLVPIEVNEVVRLNNIFFEFGKAILKPESYPELDRVVKFLNDNSTVTLEIAGHTDNVGSDSDNLKLSQDRAQSVVNYLLEKGIKSSRLTAKGYGESVPVASNDTDDGRAFNRRVEFRIVAK